MAKSLNNRSEGEGHNSDGMIDAEALSSVIADAIKIMAQQKQWGDRLKEICAKAEESGIGSKAEIRELARERFKHRDSPKVLSAKLARMAALRDALGEFSNTPLGEAAVGRGTVMEAEAPAKRQRKPKGVQAIEQAQAHLDGDGFEDLEAKIEADLDRIIGEPAGVA